MQIDKQEWNALAHAAGELNPFLLFEFLAALEDSRSVSPEQGWLPQHLTIRHRATGVLVAAIPAYIKGHSYGEYVFDHSWATLHQQLGARYYPKLQVCLFSSSKGIAFMPGTAPGLWDRNLLIGSAYAPVQLRQGGVQALLGLAQPIRP
jgi:uncharacterized protein